MKTTGVGVGAGTSLREAIAAAPGSGVVVDFQQSLFTGGPATITLTYDGPDSYSTPDPLVINGNVTINGPGAELLTLSGGQQTRLIRINGATSTIRDLTLSHGWVGDEGAAIDGHAASVTLERMIISGNITADTGTGGAHTNGGALTIIDCTIDSNEGWMGHGGVYVYNAPLTIVGSTISNNSGITAGVLFQGGTHPLKVINSTISANQGVDDAGLIVSSSGTKVIINSTIYGNTATWFTSGVSGSNVVLHNTIVANNQVTYASDNDVNGSFNSISSHNLIGYDPNGLFPSDPSNNN